MKYSIFLLLLIAVTFTNCKSKLFSVTENEDKGIKEILAFYGGECQYGIEKKVYTDKPNESVFWIKFGKSSSIDSAANWAQLHGSNIPYIFYKNLDKEKSKYTHIQCELVLGNATKLKFSYALPELEKVKEKMKLVNKIVNLIRTKNFNELKNHLVVDSSILVYDKDELTTNLQRIETGPELGNIKGFRPYGFIYSKGNNNKEILYIAGLMVRDKQNMNFSVNLDPNTKKDEIYLLNYKF